LLILNENQYLKNGEKMSEGEKAKIVNLIAYGAIAGVVGGAVDIILKFLVSSINLGKFDDIDYASQQFLGTTAGNPNVIGIFVVGIISWAFLAIIYGIILYLMRTKAGWDQDLMRYLVVALVLGVVLTVLTMGMALSTAEFDPFIDVPVQFIIGVFSVALLAPIVYYLEEQFG
jgi:hypothetical protein